MKEIINSLKQHLLAILQEYAIDVPEIMLTPCRQIEHGDLTTNIAFLLASKLRKAPQLIALEISNKCTHPMVTQVEAVSGYINFRINPVLKTRQLKQLLALGVESIITDHGKNERCLVEYVSANPTGPLHVGHGRQAAGADTLVHIMRACGYFVETEYYVNDAGLQMDVLVTSVWLRALIHNGLNITLPAGLYQGDYLVSVANEVVKNFSLSMTHEQWDAWLSTLESPVREGILTSYASKDVEIRAIKELAMFAKASLAQSYPKILSQVLDLMLSGIKEELSLLGVVMENYFSEQRLVDDGCVDNVLASLAAKGHTYENEGALWFASTRFGDDKDRVLVRSNGERTYFTNDIAYHWNKITRGYSRLINFMGSDHHGYVTRLKAAITALGSEVAIDVRLVQFVSLIRQGERVAMSTRRATFETLSDVVMECGKDATRFFYIEKHLDQPLDFDLNLAITKSQNNPVYYVQYAHARLCRLLEKAGNFSELDESVIFNEEEAELWDAVLRLDETLARCVEQLDPCFLSNYVLDLSRKVHSYYNRVPVLTAAEHERVLRLSLLNAVRKVISFSLSLLGVSSPESM